jgi:hypothetical protein
MKETTSIAAGAASKAEWSARALDLLCGLLLLVTIAALLRVTFNPVFYADEIEHAHVTWMMGQGALPYRDIHQIHLPLLWLSLSPVLSLLPETVGSLLTLRVFCLLALAGAGLAGLLALRELVPAASRSDASTSPFPTSPEYCPVRCSASAMPAIKSPFRFTS